MSDNLLNQSKKLDKEINKVFKVIDQIDYLMTHDVMFGEWRLRRTLGRFTDLLPNLRTALHGGWRNYMMNNAQELEDAMQEILGTILFDQHKAANIATRNIKPLLAEWRRVIQKSLM